VLVKRYGFVTGKEDQRRYSPAKYSGAVNGVVSGDPDFEHVTPAM
jgi:hypothetical protein